MAYIQISLRLHGKLSPTDAVSGAYAPVCETYAGGIYLYANAVPSADMTIPAIVIWG